MSACVSPKILIVEDVPSLGESYAAYLRPISARIDVVGDGERALETARSARPDVILLDVNLPDMSGIDVLRRLRDTGIASDVIVMTGEGSIRLAVDAMRNGARDFLVKPFGVDRLRKAVGKVIEDRKTDAACEPVSASVRRKPMASVSAESQFAGFVGQSAPMQDVYRLLASAAPSNATVFVTGESGTGKEVCAEALHRLSHRGDGPFVVINCAAIPRDLLESEIFGHVKGAFTGAVSDRKGAALQANGGTLFLDEICEMDVGLQAKMLRFLQDRHVQRVGEDALRSTDVRIVCATNRDPYAEVAAGRFREDLLYRLHVVPVELPPLRARGSDVILIARQFLERFAREDGKSFRAFTAEAEEALLACPWPGNVRQLQNVIRSVVVLNEGELVTREMLPPLAPALTAAAFTAALSMELPSPVLTPVAPAAVSERAIKPLDAVIRETIEFAIAKCGGSIPKAAVALTVSPSTLYRRIQSWEAEGASG